MLFKLEYNVRGLPLGEAVNWSFDVKHPIEVCFRPYSEEDKQQGHRPDDADAVCQVVLKRKPNAAVTGMFQCLAKDRLPPNSRVPDHCSYIDEDGNIKKDHIVPLFVMPKPFRSFVVDQVQKCLRDVARRAVGVLRWRLAVVGPHSPLSYKSTKWSFEGKTWFPLPMDNKVYIFPATSPFYIDNTARSDIANYVQDGKAEPLGHELYREALEQMAYHPRSALVIGIAALETGLKECLTVLTPDSQWLLENVSSPPVDKILLEYLPQLLSKNKIEDSRACHRKELTKKIKNGLNIRNKIVHGKKVDLGLDTVEEVLSSIRELLWTLDDYKGFHWAQEYISEGAGS